MKYSIRTLGCKANFADSQDIESQLKSAGGSPSRECPDVIVINSCTVTDEADKQSRALARSLAKKHPGARVVFTGCGAEVSPESFLNSGVQWVIGNQDKARFGELLRSATQGAAPGTSLGGVTPYVELTSRHPMDRDWPALSLSEHSAPAEENRRTRAFLKIQEGCNHFCTYCIIPYGRGPSRSIAKVDLIRRVQELVENGIREVVLTGTNIGDYDDQGRSAPDITPLVRAILQETDLKRLRLSSLDPVEITDSLLQLMEEEPRLCPHVHVSMQSLDARVLRGMKRKYDAVAAREGLMRIARVRREEGAPFVGMDLITGFPGESDEAFEASVALLESLPWNRLHVFPYSEREGTPATRMSGIVPKPVRMQRSERLRELSLRRARDEAHARLRARPDLNDILIDSKHRIPGRSESFWAGYTKDYRRVLVPDHGTLGRNHSIQARAQEILIDRQAGEALWLAAPVSADRT